MTKNNLPNFKEEKAIAAASLLLILSKNACDKYWFNKVMYFIERQSVVLTGQPMFNDSLFSMKYGPVVSTVNDAIDNLAYPFDNEWNKHFSLKANTIRLIKESSYDALSESEEKIIKDAYIKFEGWDFSRLKKFFHSLPEHKETTSRIDIEYDEILKNSGVDEESIQDALETISYFKILENSLHCGK
jgi:uncharacterized phage-associated protein